MIKLIQWLNSEQREKIDRIIEYIEENFNIPLASVHDLLPQKYVKFLFRGHRSFFMTFELLENEDIEEILVHVELICESWVG